MAFGKGGSSSQPQTATTVQTQSSEPWSGLKPFLEGGQGQQGLYQRAAQLSNVPIQYFPGQTVAAEDPSTIEGRRLAEARALQGAPLVTSAADLASRTMGGEFVGLNPAVEEAIGAATRPIFEYQRDVADPAAVSQAAVRGRYGSGAAEDILGRSRERAYRTAGDVGSQIALANLARERGLQQQAIGLAPGLEQAGYSPFGVLAGVGQGRTDQEQALINAAIARQSFEQGEPVDRLARLAATLQGGGIPATTTGTTVQPLTNPNSLLQGVGVASALTGMGGNLFNPTTGLFPNVLGG
jgi:hypothetical protein